VVAADARVAQRAKHAHAADAEDHFLAQPVKRVPAIEAPGQAAVEIAVLRQVGVQKIDRHAIAADSLHVIPPTA